MNISFCRWLDWALYRVFWLILTLGSLVGSACAQLYVANGDGTTIEKRDFNTGVFLGDFAGSLNGPSGIAFDSVGNLYVSCAPFSNGTILKFTPDGVSSIFANTNLAGNEYLTFDQSGNLYASYWSSQIVMKYTPEGVGSVFASGGSLDGPHGLAFDSIGNLYVANYFGNTIERFSSDGTYLGSFAIGLNNPTGLAFDSAGYLYVANAGSNLIARYAPNGFGATFADSNLSTPYGLAFDAADNLYVTNFGTDSISKFSTNGLGAVFASGFSNPSSIAFAPAPEPSSVLLLVGSGAMLLRRKRRG
jgi:DNA-binding beta-propeller fold protein YncE